MLIRCPSCGERPFFEFVYGGDAERERPAEPARSSDAAWFAYVYLRDNPRGPHRELWFHELGCGSWVEAERDTLTHVISWTGSPGSRA